MSRWKVRNCGEASRLLQVERDPGGWIGVHADRDGYK